MTYTRIKNRKFHFIYKTTCLVTGRYYIGMHSTDDLDDGYLGSGKRLSYSVRKYGKENHQREILEYFPDRQSLAKREAELLTEDVINDNNCMNLISGGHGGWEHIKRTPEQYREITRKATLASNLPTANRDRSAIARKAVKKMMVEGKPANIDWTGRTHSEETKKKVSEIQKMRLSDPTKNSQYGTCWVVHPLNGPKKINKELLGSFLKDGWVKGRKLS